MDWLSGIEAHWVWLTLGLLLATFEMLVPGVYLIWLAVAAFVTGALTYGLEPGMPLQVIIFAFASLIAVFSARRILKDKPIESADPLLNKRGARLVGEIARVTEAIENGQGRAHHGDSEWIVRGADAAAGEKVRIIGSEGAELLVEPIRQLTDGTGD